MFLLLDIVDGKLLCLLLKDRWVWPSWSLWVVNCWVASNILSRGIPLFPSFGMLYAHHYVGMFTPQRCVCCTCVCRRALNWWQVMHPWGSRTVLSLNKLVITSLVLSYLKGIKPCSAITRLNCSGKFEVVNSLELHGSFSSGSPQRPLRRMYSNPEPVFLPPKQNISKKSSFHQIVWKLALLTLSLYSCFRNELHLKLKHSSL